MPTNEPSGVASHWQRLSASASLVCTPRNASILAAYQRLCLPEGGPFTGDFVPDQFDQGLPYLFETVAPGYDENDELVIQYADLALLEFLGAKPGAAIATLELGGVQDTFVKCLHLVSDQIAPALVRVIVKQLDASLRQFELLALPLLSSDGEMVATLIGSLDEVSAKGPQIRAIDWDNVSVAPTARIGAASLIVF